MTYARCPACSRTHFECVCSKACGVCGIVSNHSTRQHEDALREQEAQEHEEEDT